MYPLRRNRRLRTNETIRGLVRETIISPKDFLVPLFVVEGKGIKEEIASMPNYYRYSLDLLEKEVKSLWDLGLKSVLLFVKVPDNLKDNKGTEALNPDGLMQRAIKTVKHVCPDMLVMTDVALDPFSSYGHDGIIADGKIVNDDTVKVLAEMSVSHAEAGADLVAPLLIDVVSAGRSMPLGPFVLDGLIICSMNMKNSERTIRQTIGFFKVVITCNLNNFAV